MRTVQITWMNGNIRKFDVDTYSVHDGAIWLVSRNVRPKVIPTHNVMIMEEED
jgi:hypothetical protein